MSRVGGTTYTNTTQVVGQPTTTTYVQNTTTSAPYASQSYGYTQGGYTQGGYTQSGAGSNVYQGAISAYAPVVQAAQYAVGTAGTAQRAVAEEIPVESRIEYIPFEKKYVEYDQV